MPFRKPLEPATLDELDQLPGAPDTPVIRAGRPVADAELVAEIARLVNDAPHGLIVCGPRCPGGNFPAAVAELARRTGYPIMADPLSGVRYGPQTHGAPVVSAYESFLNTRTMAWDDPQVILRFGAVPTSKWLNEYLGRVQTPGRIHVRANGIWADDAHQTTHFVQADEATLCRGLTDALTRAPARAWTDAIMAAEQTARAVAGDYFAAQPFDGSVMAALVEELPAGAQLFVGSSLPVRHLDQFGTVRVAPLHVYANRGASGIDGVTSSALGVAAAHRNTPTVLAIGDVSFIHDLNGLLAVDQLGLDNVTIVLFNNDGGGIFRRLPVAKLEPAFTPLFLTPHGLDFAHVAALFGLEHQVCTDLHTFTRQLHAAMNAPVPTILEVRTNSVEDLNHQRAVVRRIVETEKMRLGD
jgi:2-succinyl-5-enolpyruvyl-6-hydroxy-3-cyclohexene-1-carboxylate synthase